MLVVALIAVAVGMATLALRDANASKLEEEGGSPGARTARASASSAWLQTAACRPTGWTIERAPRSSVLPCCAWGLSP